MWRATAMAVFLMACTAGQPPASLDARIDALFAAYAEGVQPGYAIGIVRDGELVFARGYGYGNLARRELITPDTSLNLASLSKQLTAAAVALEIVDGRLDPDGTLGAYWPESPEFVHDISIAHLIYMTSGLPEYYRLPSPRGGWLSENEFTVDDAVGAVFAAGELEFAPGSRWAYSNSNYQVLAELVARRNDTRFPEFMRTRVFEPAGMQGAWVDAPIDLERDGRALSYNWENGAWQESPRKSPHYGGSGVYASLRDLAKWDAALYGESVFGEAFTRQMLATRRFAHDKENDAFGLVHSEYRGHPIIWYEGGDYGVSTYMVRLPEREETVICLANFGDAGCLGKARAVVDVLLAFYP